MGRVAEAFTDQDTGEIAEVARLTGEDYWDVRREYEEESKKGIGWNEFVVSKTKKKKRKK